MAIKLPAAVSSAQDLQSMILDIQAYATWYGQTVIKQHLELSQTKDAPTLPKETVELVRASVSDAKAGLSRKDLDSLVADLQELLHNLPSLTITLAAPPTGEVKRVLVAWCRDNIADNVLVSFKFNSTLLGGMVVRYGSRIFDWSFRRQILNNRGNFPQHLRGAEAVRRV